ncbi:MAG: hypothetical protein OHK0044_30610 [Burkholderiaceae bacterium]
MWICLSDAFYSIVAHRSRPGHLLVRARRQGDIERLWPDADVSDTPAADYRYRAIVPADRVAHAIAGAVRSIDYGNFKASVHDDALAAAYGKVWAILAALQR